MEYEKSSSNSNDDLHEVNSRSSYTSMATSQIHCATQIETRNQKMAKNLNDDSILKAMVIKATITNIKFVQYKDRLFEKKPDLD